MKNRKGFTLIELLVVVLIIGILAAIALPMYTKTVEKARAVNAIVWVRTASDSVQRYVMENGGFEDVSLDSLDIEPASEIKGYTCGMSEGNFLYLWCYKEFEGKEVFLGAVVSEDAARGQVYCSASPYSDEAKKYCALNGFTKEVEMVTGEEGCGSGNWAENICWFKP